ETKINFFKFIKDKLPHFYNKIKYHYKGDYVNLTYQKRLDNTLDKISQKYPLKEKKINYTALEPIDKQLTLF
ncbi:MAG: hypothetical protein K5622_01815, partial [Endomicrobiaceae bacterium]|nr:hypothetical protein [Endomicrobiaceae bacterium]